MATENARSIIDYAEHDMGKEARDAMYAEIHDRVLAHLEAMKHGIAENLIAVDYDGYQLSEEADFHGAIKSLHNSWSGFHEVPHHELSHHVDPHSSFHKAAKHAISHGGSVHHFDDGEGGFEANAMVAHNPKTGEVHVKNEHDDGHKTYKSISHAMPHLKSQLDFSHRHDKSKQKPQSNLAGRTPVKPGRSGTLTKTTSSGRKGDIKSTLGSHKKPHLPEEYDGYELDESAYDLTDPKHPTFAKRYQGYLKANDSKHSSLSLQGFIKNGGKPTKHGQ
jgi:hypothetical protein